MYEDVRWLSYQPLAYKFEFDNHKPLIVSHAPLRTVEDSVKIFDEDLQFYERENLVWNRTPNDVETDYFNISGHNSREDVFINHSNAFIDTGLVGKKLTAINYPSLEIIQEKVM
jgi:hypothetical protein